jgi:hypothetical protein
MPDSSLFADAEATEYFAEKVVTAELAGDASQRSLRQTQFLGKEFELRHLRLRRGDARIGQQENDVGALDLAPGAFDADLLDLVFGRAQARRCR